MKITAWLTEICSTRFILNWEKSIHKSLSFGLNNKTFKQSLHFKLTFINLWVFPNWLKGSDRWHQQFWQDHWALQFKYPLKLHRSSSNTQDALWAKISMMALWLIMESFTQKNKSIWTKLRTMALSLTHKNWLKGFKKKTLLKKITLRRSFTQSVPNTLNWTKKTSPTKSTFLSDITTLGSNVFANNSKHKSSATKGFTNLTTKAVWKWKLMKNYNSNSGNKYSTSKKEPNKFISKYLILNYSHPKTNSNPNSKEKPSKIILP